MPIQATNDFVYIIRDEAEKEKGGLFIPSKGTEKQHKGKIISVGELTQDRKIKGAVGKTGIFHKGVGFEIEYEGTTYLVLTANQIIGVDAASK